MSNFTPTVPFTTNFDGDTVSMDLARLKRKHVIIVAPFMKGVAKDGTAVIEFGTELSYSNAMIKILPEVVFNFNGLVTADSTLISLEDAINETYFSALIGAIMSKLFLISKPEEEEKDELKKSSSDTSEESDAENETTG